MWASAPGSLDAAHNAVVAMINLLGHRGPDDEDIRSFPDSGLVLGHTRLAIRDLSSAGRQPMSSPDGSLVLVHNGELYNDLEERNRLEGRYDFGSRSDSEVALAVYATEPERFPSALDGMFALALWDVRRRRLLLARDRMGKKPLYVARRPGLVAFASEIGALRAVFGTRAVDEHALTEYLVLGRVTGERTIDPGITELLPATVMVFDSPDDVSVHRYWSIPEPTGSHRDRATAVVELDEILRGAVHRRLRSDVPLGVFLSGGIDSGLIASYACEAAHPLTTIAVGYAGASDDDERGLAAMTARALGTHHHEIEVSPADLASMLTFVVERYGEPFADPSAPLAAVVSAHAREMGLTVALSGDGGDELFGGYRRHQAAAIARRMPSMARFALRRLAPLASERGARALRGLGANGVERYMEWASYGLRPHELSWLGYPMAAVQQVVKETSQLLDAAGPDPRRQMLAMDLEHELPDVLLPKIDIASMACGLELRSPFLDRALVEWSADLPIAWRSTTRGTKPLLRDLAERRLPREVVRAPKRGFTPPLSSWLSGETTGLVGSLCRGESPLRDMFDAARLRDLVERRAPITQTRWAHIVWSLLVLDKWLALDATREVSARASH